MKHIFIHIWTGEGGPGGILQEDIPDSGKYAGLPAQLESASVNFQVLQSEHYKHDLLTLLQMDI